MGQRVKFEDMWGKPRGYVDLVGKKLRGNNEFTKHLIDDWEHFNGDDDAAQQFMEHYGNPDTSNGHLNCTLVDSAHDTTKYPKS